MRLKVGQLYKVNNAALVMVRKLESKHILVEFPKCGKLASCSQKLTYNNHFVPVKDWDTPIEAS